MQRKRDGIRDSGIVSQSPGRKAVDWKGQPPLRPNLIYSSRPVAHKVSRTVPVPRQRDGPGFHADIRPSCPSSPVQWRDELTIFVVDGVRDVTVCRTMRIESFPSFICTRVG
jgi:hypothetical protein